MLATELGLGPLEAEFMRVVFLLLRVGSALFAAPFFGAAAVPPLARLSVSAALAIFISIWIPVTVPENVLSLQGMLAAAGEIVIGLSLGFVLTLIFAAPVIAAEVIGGSMGMSMTSVSDPASGGTTTAFGQYFSILLVLIFLAVGGHLQFVALIAESYRSFPPGETWLGAQRFAQIPHFASMMFETAVRIALPVTLLLLLVQVVTGMLSRSAPSLNLFALGLPAGVMAGLAALIISAPILHDRLAAIVETSLDGAERIIAR